MTQQLAMAACAALLLAAPTFGQVPGAAMPVTPCSSCGGETLSAPAADGFCNAPTPATAPGFWLSGEYLFAWIPGDHVPPLITTSPPGTPRAQAGVLRQPGTRSVFGGDTVNGGMRSGIRLQTGCWFNDDRTVGFEAGTMILESQAAGAMDISNGTPILARPFFNTSTQANDAVEVAFPGVATGTVAAQVRSGNFYEAHFDFAQNCYDRGWFRLDALIGYRFFGFNEGLGIQQISFPVGTGIVPGSRIATYDSFRTRNEFNGGDFGFRARFIRGNLSADFVTRLGVGFLERHVNISGQTLTTVPGTPPSLQSGGLLALPSNIGSYSPGYETLLPEFGLNLAWQALPYLKFRVGYSLLLLDRIARPGDQIDLHVNPGLVPFLQAPLQPPLRPQFSLSTSDIWLQTLSVGMELTF